ncbi:hypothetical protein ACFQXA_19360 [Nocardiopsis composta]
MSFYDPSSERRLMVATWDNTGGLSSLDQLETDDERFSSSDDYENYQTEDLRQVPASELPSGWGRTTTSPSWSTGTPPTTGTSRTGTSRSTTSWWGTTATPCP